MAITTPEAFLKVLEQSRLLTPEQLADAKDTTLLTSDLNQLCEILIDQGLLTGWQVDELLLGHTSFFLANYVLLELLGRGGMGGVFLARHRTMNRTVALKIVSKKVGKDPASLQRFLTEGRASASLDHPNIVRAYDVGSENNRFYIVMEHVPGEDLEEIVDLDGPLDFEFAVDCIRQAADGLAHAHQRNLIHCDVKPSNLLVTDQGVVKILDMGMARALTPDAEGESQQDVRVLGTVDYMAPEQAMEGPKFDHRADIYSLGCTLYFLLTGRPPFAEGSLAQRIVKHQTEAPPPLKQLRPDIPADLAAICAKMMAKEPDARYQTADEISAALSKWRPPAAPSPPAKNGLSPGAANGTASSVSGSSAALDLRAASLGGAESGPTLPQHGPGRARRGDKPTWIFWMAGSAAALVLVLGVLVVAQSFRSSGETSQGGAPSPSPGSPQASPGNDSPDHEASQPSNNPDERRTNAEPNANKTVAPAGEKPSPSTSPTPRPKTPDTKRPDQRTDDSPQSPASPTGVPKASASATIDVRISPTSPTRKTSPPKDNSTKPRQRRVPKDPGPFSKMAGEVELPEVGKPSSDQQPTVTLGMIATKPDAPREVELLGGETAVAGGQRFALEPDASGSAWNIRFVTSAGQPSDVARLWFNNQELLFGWAPPTRGVPLTDLRFCALRITVEGKKKQVNLGKARIAQPLLVDLLASGGKGPSLTHAPPPAAGLRWQVVGVEGVSTKPVYSPGRTISANQRMEVVLTGGDEPRIFLRVEYRVSSRETSLDATPYFQFANDRTPTRFSLVAMRELQHRRKQLQVSEKSLTKKSKGVKGNGEPDGLTAARLDAVRRQLEEIDRLEQTAQAIHQTAKIHFREFLAIKDGEITLVRMKRRCPLKPPLAQNDLERPETPPTPRPRRSQAEGAPFSATISTK